MGDLIALYTVSDEDLPRLDPVHEIQRLWTGEAVAAITWADSDLPASGGGWERFGVGSFTVTDASGEFARLCQRQQTVYRRAGSWIAWGETFLRMLGAAFDNAGHRTTVSVNQGVNVYAQGADRRLVFFTQGPREPVTLCIPEPSPPQPTDKWWSQRAVAATEHLMRKHPDLYVPVGP